MILPCYPPQECTPGPFGIPALLAGLRQSGIEVGEPVQVPPVGELCLWWMEGGIEELPPEERQWRVVVPLGGWDPELAPEKLRAKLGLLAMVDPDEWERSRLGLLVGEGLYGDATVARRAGLRHVKGKGLQGEKFMSLPQLLGRFLAAADTKK